MGSIRKPLRAVRASMKAWKVSDSLNNPFDASINNKLKLVETRLPTISQPSDILVKVHSTSVNPLDLRMVYGYGRRVLDLLDITTNSEPRITNDRYPLTLGRDFSGEVISTGLGVTDLKPGDMVFGAVEPQRSGAHADYVTVPSYCLTKKPQNIDHDQASCIPFVALTAYSALSTFGNLNRSSSNGKQCLILGGSGGVGSFAVQLLKIWGANVVATSSEQKLGWLENTLFVDQAVCYTDSEQMESLNGRFDFVLDCGIYDKTSSSRLNVVANSLRYLKPYSGSLYVTLSPPVLSNTDKHGLVLGSAGSLMEAVWDTLTSLRSLNSARWAFFLPNKGALNYISHLLADGAITPHISSTFGFKDMPQAFEELDRGGVLGKVVVKVLDS